MHIQPGGEIVFDLVEQTKELLMSVTPVAIADRHPRRYVHSRKQRRDSMPLIIVELPGRDARRQRQNRLGPVQRNAGDIGRSVVMQMSERRQIAGCSFDGPLGLDTALEPARAREACLVKMATFSVNAQIPNQE
jgi:surfactin synthase thioesterase subunit